MSSEGQYTQRITSQFLQEVAPRAIDGERVLLYDFVTGEHNLLARHREGLDRCVIPWLQRPAPAVSVWIGGLASRRGNRQHNRGLAFVRAREVERYILSRVPEVEALTNPHSIITHHYGDRYSIHGDENNAYYRSVLIVLSFTSVPPRMPSRPPVDPRFQITHRFRIAMILGIDGGEVLALGFYRFIIDYDPTYDGPPSDPVLYFLAGGGIGGGLPLSTSSGPYDWNSFSTQQLTTTRGFSGRGHWGSASVSIGDTLLGGSFLRLYPSSHENSVLIDPFNSSFGVGAGATIVHGPFWFDENATRSFRRGHRRE